MKIAIKTLGCKSNRYESDKIYETLKKSGFEVIEVNEGAYSFHKPVDYLIVNTCTVTQIADRKSRQAIRSFKHVNPLSKILVFGCGAKVAKEDYAKIPEIDFLAETREEILDYFKNFNPQKCNYQMEESLRTRALLKIQDGCDNFCTYCIIPRARGKAKSFSSKSLIKEAQKLEKEGYMEIVITGINIAQWKEKDLRIADLLELLIDNTKQVRFRISSIEPENFDKKFFKLFASGRLCPHIHMSLQSGSDSVLERMRRNYDTKFFAEICGKFKEAVPEINFTTDIIVGFPGETEKEFEETCKFIKKIGFLKIHIFPYSKRKNTAAYYMNGQVPENIKKLRAKKLAKISEEEAKKIKKKYIGKIFPVLVERGGGFTSNYLPVEIQGRKLNQIVPVKLNRLLENGKFEITLNP